VDKKQAPSLGKNTFMYYEYETIENGGLWATKSGGNGPGKAFTEQNLTTPSLLINSTPTIAAQATVRRFLRNYEKRTRRFFS